MGDEAVVQIPFTGHHMSYQVCCQMLPVTSITLVCLWHTTSILTLFYYVFVGWLGNGGTQGKYIACAIIGPAMLFTTCRWESYFLMKLDSYIWFCNSIGCAN